MSRNCRIPPELEAHLPRAMSPGSTVAELCDAREAIIARTKPSALPDIQSAYRRHVRPTLGEMPIVLVTVAIVVAWVRFLVERRLASATIRKLLDFLRALFEDAVTAELLPQNPVRVPRGVLPPKAGADELAAERQVLSPADVGALLFDPRIPLERRVFWALLLLTGMRFGEAAALRWRDLSPWDPLHEIRVSRTWSTKAHVVTSNTKTGVPRYVPVHPVLLRFLHAARRVFERLFGRSPGLDDLVAPRRTLAGDQAHRLETMMLRRWHHDLAILGLRARPMHKARHTFVTLLLRAGARPDIVRRLTHPSRRSDSFLVYDHVDWRARCDAIRRLDLDALESRSLLDVHRGDGPSDE